MAVEDFEGHGAVDIEDCFDGESVAPVGVVEGGECRDVVFFALVAHKLEVGDDALDGVDEIDCGGEFADVDRVDVNGRIVGRDFFGGNEQKLFGSLKLFLQFGNRFQAHVVPLVFVFQFDSIHAVFFLEPLNPFRVEGRSTKDWVPALHGAVAEDVVF